MDVITPPETRGRSRSRTPFLRSSCDRESCLHLGEGHVHERKTKKSPQVQTIIEESFETRYIPDRQVQQKSSSSSSRTVKASKVITSDYSSDDISPENSRTRGNVKSVTITTATETTIAGGKHSSQTRNAASSQMMATVAAGQVMSPIDKLNSKELSQNTMNSPFEASIQTSTPINAGNNSSRRIKFASATATATNGNAGGEHISYEEYRAAGDYWNKYPKTDYTYSRLSPHRREIKPGVVAMPNMSRKSLDNHHERIDFRIQQNPAQESYIRKRYAGNHYTTTSSKRSTTKLLRNDVQYDSQDEFDMSHLETFDRRYRETIVTRIWTTIVTIFHTLTAGFWRSDRERYHRSVEESGFFGRILSRLSSVLVTVFRPIYVLISSTLFADTLLLRSSNPDNRAKKRFLLILLLLLPMLLLGAWSFMEADERRAIVLRAQNLIPASLIGFRSSSILSPSNWREIFKFDFNLLTTPLFPSSSSTSSFSLHGMPNELKQQSLSDDEFQRLLNHINNYVLKLVDDKLADERKLSVEREAALSKELAVLVADSVRSNVVASVNEAQTKFRDEHQFHKLDDADLSRIVELVIVKLGTRESSSASQPGATFSADNLEQITRLIKDNIQVHDKNLDVMGRIAIDELLLQIMHSPKFQIFVQEQVRMGSLNDTLNEQQVLIDRLQSEIASLKAQLVSNADNDEHLRQSIKNLFANYDSFAAQLAVMESNANSRFDRLHEQMDAKIVEAYSQQSTSIDKQIKLILAGILGFKDTENVDEIDLKSWTMERFVTKEFLEERLAAMGQASGDKLQEELNRFAGLFLKEITEKIKIEILKTIEMRESEKGSDKRGAVVKFEDEEIRAIVRDVLAVYDADKTGRVDYALESAGGQVLSTRCTENYQTKSAQISIFGIPLWYPSNTPRIAISPSVQPGECWAFQGFPGFLVVKLNTMVYVTGFTLEHIPKSLTPFGKVDSAPKNFTVWGLADERDPEPTLFGEYEYADNDVALQYFPVQHKPQRPFDIVELRVESNHGNMHYTCLYRFRVHGTPHL